MVLLTGNEERNGRNAFSAARKLKLNRCGSYHESKYPCFSIHVPTFRNFITLHFVPCVLVSGAQGESVGRGEPPVGIPSGRTR